MRVSQIPVDYQIHESINFACWLGNHGLWSHARSLWRSCMEQDRGLPQFEEHGAGD